MEDDTVREGVETILVKAATTIMAGNGFSYVVPSRAASNQLYVRALDRIVLKVGCLCGCESGIVVWQWWQWWQWWVWWCLQQRACANQGPLPLPGRTRSWSVTLRRRPRCERRQSSRAYAVGSSHLFACCTLPPAAEVIFFFFIRGLISVFRLLPLSLVSSHEIHRFSAWCTS